MQIDCDTCALRDLACESCVVTVLLGAGPPATGTPTGQPLDVDEAERRALEVLADSGLVPRLRLLPQTGSGAPGASGATPVRRRAVS